MILYLSILKLSVVFSDRGLKPLAGRPLLHSWRGRRYSQIRLMVHWIMVQSAYWINVGPVVLETCNHPTNFMCRHTVPFERHAPDLLYLKVPALEASDEYDTQADEPETDKGPQSILQSLNILIYFWKSIYCILVYLITLFNGDLSELEVVVVTVLCVLLFRFLCPGISAKINCASFYVRTRP